MSEEKNTPQAEDDEYSSDETSEYEYNEDDVSSEEYDSEESDDSSDFDSRSESDEETEYISSSSSSSSDSENEIIDLTENNDDKDSTPIYKRTRSKSGNNETVPKKKIKMITWDETDQLKRIRKGLKPLTILMKFSLDDDVCSFEILDTDTEELETITFIKNNPLNLSCTCGDSYYICQHIAYIFNVMCGMDQEEIYEFSIPKINLDEDIKNTVMHERKDQIKKMWDMVNHNCDLLSKLSKRKEEEVENPEMECTICREELYKERIWKCFKCKNAIHNLCMIYHFKKNPKCPLCSFDIIKYLNDEDNSENTNNGNIDNFVEEPFN